ncbi:MAG: peptidase, partial [Phenylobacterium sp.]|nr:peptidase [Phenylobacterium sp.]
MKRVLLAATAFAVLSQPAFAQAPAAHLTTPREALGHDIGEDYFLANYSQLVSYWKTLAAQSDRAKMVDIGETSEGRRQYMMIVSSPQNLAKLDRYKEIAARLANAEGLTDDQAHALAAEGKSVIWIDGGMHASEVEHAQALMAGVYDMLSSNDPETRKILDNVVILFGQANPDGQDLLANWYMRNADPLKREFDTLPVIYQKYVGHDNNRDSYMVSQKETTNLNKIFFREWYPQIIYNHHQTGPLGAVVFIPPFRDPFNYNYDPLIMTELSEVGATMHSRLVSEGKGGSAMRSAATYSTWNNGMERTVAYFHNSIGILTEIIGHPTPMQLPLVADNQLPRNDLPLPVKPQLWHLKQSIDYSLSMNRAVLDYASRNKERLLMNIWRMGANSVERGSTDSWTTTPKRIEALNDAAKGRPMVGEGRNRGLDPKLFDTVLRDPALRDARGYVIPADQADFPTAVKFVNALIK